nr:protein FAR1-RELATED SEQUENCE 5-like [Ipomoea batatas]
MAHPGFAKILSPVFVSKDHFELPAHSGSATSPFSRDSDFDSFSGSHRRLSPTGNPKSRDMPLASSVTSHENLTGVTVGGDSDRLERMTQVIKGLKEEFTHDGATQELAKGNKGVIEAFCETRAPDIVTIKPPSKVKNKGSGRRIKSNREKGIEKSRKPKRLCRSCNQFARHDSRNYPTG